MKRWTISKHYKASTHTVWPISNNYWTFSLRGRRFWGIASLHQCKLQCWDWKKMNNSVALWSGASIDIPFFEWEKNFQDSHLWISVSAPMLECYWHLTSFLATQGLCFIVFFFNILIACILNFSTVTISISDKYLAYDSS